MKNPRRERHHRKRVIANRLRIIRDVYGGSYGLGSRGPGSLSKDHLANCSCYACSPRYDDWGKLRQRERRDWIERVPTPDDSEPPAYDDGDQIVLAGIREHPWVATADMFGVQTVDDFEFPLRARTHVGDVWGDMLMDLRDDL